jgi:hypothetical protein
MEVASREFAQGLVALAREVSNRVGNLTQGFSRDSVASE